MRERTNTASALSMLRDRAFTRSNGARDNARKVAFIVTDGNSNINSEETIAEAIRVSIRERLKG